MRGLFFAALALAASALAASVPKNLVTASGTKFVKNGKPFYFVGANSYWLPLLNKNSDVDLTLQSMAKSGVKVLRTWGFNAINQTEVAGALTSGLTYYQVWGKGGWTLNTGPQGLQRLDYVIETAAKYDIQVILTFTNNWVGYGGAELYINWLYGAPATHDVFFTDATIIASYQKYVKTIVNRYKNSPNIFAWELMNEARCLGDLPGSAACPPGTGKGFITTWYKQQAAYVKSLDPYHMVTTGGEGHFNKKTPLTYNGQSLQYDYNFDGAAGEDFDAELTLKDIDFGTYHMYPQYWYGNVDYPGSGFSMTDWGVFWETQHVLSAQAAKKPLILEEFGMSGQLNQTDIYPVWVQNALDTYHGIMPWQFGQLGLTENGGNRPIKYADALIGGASPNDGFAIYSNETSIYDIFVDAAIIQASRSG